MTNATDAETKRDALAVLAAHALPEDSPGAWIRAAIAATLAGTDQ